MISKYIDIVYILQIVKGGEFCDCKTEVYFTGKHLWLNGILAWPKPIVQIISLEKFRGYQLICEIHKTFPPQTICNTQ